MRKSRIISVLIMVSFMLSFFSGCKDNDNDEAVSDDRINIEMSKDSTSEVTETNVSDETTEVDVVFTPEEDSDMTCIYAYDKDGKTVEIAKLYTLSDNFVIDTEYGNYTGLVIDKVAYDLADEYGCTYDEAKNKIFNDKLMIYSAADISMQQQMEDVYKNRITFPAEGDSEDSIQSSMVILDYEGRIIAAAGKLGENDGTETTLLDRVRVPGSCIKPLSSYAPAIELDYYTWSSLIPNFGISVSGEESAWPTNYGGVTGSISDLRNLSEAIAPSFNTIPARIIDSIGVEISYNFLKNRFNISTLTENDKYYAPLVLGETEKGMNSIEMAAAYVTFGNGGVYYEPWCYYNVTDSDGKVILQPDREGEQVISSGTADVMLQLLRCAVTYPTGNGRAYSVDNQWSWAQSGTTTDNCDKWFCGGTAYYVGCVWTGFDDITKPINTSYYGQNPAGKVYKEVMTRVHEGLEYKEFTMGEESVSKTFCIETGLLADSGCESTDIGWYKKNCLPDVCTGYCNG